MRDQELRHQIMTESLPTSSLQLRSLVTEQGTLELSLVDVPMPPLKPDEVLVRVEAAPINPSDLGLLLAGADVQSARLGGTSERPVMVAPLLEGASRALAARVGKPLSVGNEGAGTVVAAGSSAEAQKLLGRTVAVAGGSMYSQYRAVNSSLCLLLPPGTSAKEGASSFVNPLTALGMIETMLRGGTQGPRPYGGGIQFGSDAGETLSRGGGATRRHRSQAGTGEAVEVDRRDPRLRLKLTLVHGRPHRCPQGHVGHHGL